MEKTATGKADDTDPVEEEPAELGEQCARVLLLHRNGWLRHAR